MGDAPDLLIALSFIKVQPLKFRFNLSDLLAVLVRASFSGPRRAERRRFESHLDQNFLPIHFTTYCLLYQFAP